VRSIHFYFLIKPFEVFCSGSLT